MYRKDEYKEPDGDGLDYRHYTSPAAAIYADKLISFIAKAVPIVKIPHVVKNPVADPEANDRRDDRETDDAAERFYIGILKAVDERLGQMGLAKLQNVWGFYASVRGGPVMGRALLVKEDDPGAREAAEAERERRRGEQGEKVDVSGPFTKTFADIMPWDPTHVSYELGHAGLVWAAYSIKMTWAEIKSKYGVTIPEDEGSQDGNSGILVHDFYDETHNYVLTEDLDEGFRRFLKPATPHGSPRVPVVFASVGSAPPLQGGPGTEGGIQADFNESVFKNIRGINDNNNLIMSILLELVARAREQPKKIFSSTGDKTLEGENPDATGVDIPLRMGEEDIVPLGDVEAAKETGSLLALISGEFQRASLPNTVYGELPFQLSGFAITQLRQGVETPLEAPLDGTTQAILQGLRLIKDQYLTDRFDTMQLSGVGQNRRYFSEEITPDMIRDAGDLTFKLSPQLPRDDAAKFQQADIARKGPFPLYTEIDIHENILEDQDASEVVNAIKVQQGERGLPLAGLLEMYQAMLREGRQDMAQIYFRAAEMLFEQQEMARMQAMAGAGGAPGQGGPNGSPPNGTRTGGSTTGFSPAALPAAAQGRPPPAPTPQAGPNVPPNSPRPGARGPLTPAERLRRIGLFGPRT